MSDAPKQVVDSNSSPRRGERADRARRRRARRRERGIALVMVLGALTILTVMLTEFQDETSAEFGSALSARDSLKAEYAARSAVNLSRLLIAAEPTIRKALGPFAMIIGTAQLPVWEFADDLLGAFNDQEGAELFKALANVDTSNGVNLGLEGAGFRVDIVDEDSKINLNKASRQAITSERLATELLGLIGAPQYDPMFQERDRDGNFSDRSTVCGAIIDWVDYDQQVAPCDPTAANAPTAAPEDTYYQLLDDSYQRKNAPFDSLEELRLVRGVGDDFWATFVDPSADDPNQRTMTVWGQGQINVNTANAQTLLALICGSTRPPAKICTDPAETVKFLGLMEMVRQFTKGAALFPSPKMFIRVLQHQGPMGPLLATIGLEPITGFTSQKELEKAITTQSKVFSMYATGFVRAGKRETRVRIHAVVDFRGAPKPPEAPAFDPNDPSALAGALQSLAGGQNADSVSGDDEQPIGDTLKPYPGGRIVYYRVD